MVLIESTRSYDIVNTMNKIFLIVLIVAVVLGVGAIALWYGLRPVASPSYDTNIPAPVYISTPPSSTPQQPPSSGSGTPGGKPVAAPGGRCGGNMTTAPTCGTGYHCAPEPGTPIGQFGDIGGIC